LEFGPRALGNRSIIADARSSTMQSALNLKIKYRESFRPFAPAVLREDVADWFELDTDSPYTLLVADVAERRRRPTTPGDRALLSVHTWDTRPWVAHGGGLAASDSGCGSRRR
jgi:carbamoyltransferase